jgi:hypothetical protein
MSVARELIARMARTSGNPIGCAATQEELSSQSSVWQDV